MLWLLLIEPENPAWQNYGLMAKVLMKCLAGSLIELVHVLRISAKAQIKNL
jgi:hypothetical protein